MIKLFKMNKILICLVFLSISFAAQYTYQEINNNQSNSYTYSIVKTDSDYKLSFLTNSRKVTIFADHQMQARKIELIQDKNSFTVERDNNTLVFKGMYKDKQLNKSIKIDKDPWFGNYHSLSQFAISKLDRQEYYMAILETQDIMKMVAIKEKVETVKIGDKNVDTQKVRITLADWRSMFWSSYAWFRLTDGLLVKTEELRGPPGSSLYYTELIE